MKLKNGSYVIGNETYDALIDEDTNHLRTVAGLITPIIFQTGVIDANETYEFVIPTNLKPVCLWVQYASNPSGTVTIEVWGTNHVKRWALMVNTNQGSEGNAFIYEFKPFVAKIGEYDRIKPSVAVEGTYVYCEPIGSVTEVIGQKVTV